MCLLRYSLLSAGMGGNLHVGVSFPWSCWHLVWPHEGSSLPQRSAPPTPNSGKVWIGLFLLVEIGPWWRGRGRCIAKSSTDAHTHQALLTDRYVLKLCIHLYCKYVNALVKKKILKGSSRFRGAFGIMFSQSLNTKSTATVYGYGSENFWFSFARARNDQGPDEGLKCWWADLFCTCPCPQSVRQMLRKATVSSLPARGASLWRTTMIQLCLQLFPPVPPGGLISCVLDTWTSTPLSQFPPVAFVQWGWSLVAVETQQNHVNDGQVGQGKGKGQKAGTQRSKMREGWIGQEPKQTRVWWPSVLTQQLLGA